MEHFTHKMFKLILGIWVYGSLFCPPQTAIFDRYAVSFVVEWGFSKDGEGAKAEDLSKIWRSPQKTHICLKVTFTSKKHVYDR